MRLRGIGCLIVTKGLLRSQHKHPEAAETPPIYATGTTAWVGGQEREARRKEEESGLITHEIHVVCERPSHTP